MAYNWNFRLTSLVWKVSVMILRVEESGYFQVTPLLCEKCPNMELFWSVFSHIRTEYGKVLRISLYSVQMWEKTDQKKLRIWTLFTQGTTVDTINNLASCKAVSCDFEVKNILTWDIHWSIFCLQKYLPSKSC